VNADLIAVGLSPFDPAAVAVRAGRVMVEEIRRHVRDGESFALETALAGHRYSQLIPRWQANGYRVHLIFLSLKTVELAVERVATRVAQGGHNIDDAVIRRRYKQGARNFKEVYRGLVDSWQLYDNSGDEPILIREGRKR
jgi:predicted ABC-type ATPase